METQKLIGAERQITPVKDRSIDGRINLEEFLTQCNIGTDPVTVKEIIYNNTLRIKGILLSTPLVQHLFQQLEENGDLQSISIIEGSSFVQYYFKKGWNQEKIDAWCSKKERLNDSVLAVLHMLSVKGVMMTTVEMAEWSADPANNMKLLNNSVIQKNALLLWEAGKIKRFEVVGMNGQSSYVYCGLGLSEAQIASEQSNRRGLRAERVKCGTEYVLIMDAQSEISTWIKKHQLFTQPMIINAIKSKLSSMGGLSYKKAALDRIFDDLEWVKTVFDEVITNRGQKVVKKYQLKAEFKTKPKRN